MYSSRPAPISTRRESLSSANYASGPLSNTSSATTSSRRQQLALFRHASSKRASAKAMNQTRQHAKQIAMQLSTHQSQPQEQVDFFADFSAAFPEPNPVHPPSDQEDLFATAAATPRAIPAPSQQPTSHPTTSRSNNALLRRRLSRSNAGTARLHTDDSFASDDNDETPAPVAASSQNVTFFEEDPFSPEAQRRAERELERQQQQMLLAQQALQQQAKMQARAAAQRAATEQQAEKARHRVEQIRAQQQQSDAMFHTDWPDDDSTHPSGSVASVTTPHRNDYHRSVSSPPAFTTPLESPPPPPARSHSSIGATATNHVQTSPASIHSGGGTISSGAAARRRVRNHMRRSGATGGSIDGTGEADSSHSYSPASSVSSRRQAPTQQQATLPQSPMHFKSTQPQRWQQQQFHHQHSDASSIGASSAGSKQQPRSAAGSVGSTRSVTSASSSGQTDLFDTKHPDAGFRFDAFGLDESQINREVTEAMQEIAHQNPNLSFFAHDDDFSTSNVWDHSPNTSRTSTPTRLSTEEQQDGFVDGFRVMNKPSGARQSPTSTERSSLTSDSSGRINLFKQKAGFHESKPLTASRKVIQYSANNGLTPLGRSAAEMRKRQNSARQMMQLELPKLQQEPLVRKKSQDVDFFDPGFESSDAEGFESDAGGATNATATTADPSEVPSSADESIRPQEEKKEDDKIQTPEQPQGQLVATSLKSSWRAKTVNHQEARNDPSVPPETGSAFKRVTLKKPLHPFRSPSNQNSLALPTKQNFQDSKPVPTLEQPTRLLEGPSYERRQTQPSVSSGRSSPVSTQEETSSEHGILTEGENPGFRTEALKKNELEAATSFETLRDRLRPVGSSDDKFAKAKSDGGPIANYSTVNAVMRKFDAASVTSPSGSKSDAGTPSPAFAQVKLRKTSFAKIEDSRQQQIESYDAEVPSDAPRVEDRPTDIRQSTEKKMTYRERRELELQQQREEEEKRKAEEEELLRKNDVASQIRRRVASVTQLSANLPAIPTSHVSGTTLYQSLRSTKVDNQLTTREASSALQTSSSPSTSSTAVTPPFSLNKSIRPPVDLVIQPSMSGELDTSPSREADVMVSRLLDMKQSDKVAPSVPKSDTGDPAHADKGSHQLHTPKATMMMLNAFLAGREAIASHESSSLTERPTMIEVGEAETGKINVSRVATASPTQFPSDLPALKDDPKYAKYFKMLSVGMPMDVVKHAMTRDGFDPSVMDQDHNKPVGVPLNRDPKYAKYFKMLGIGLPMDAVKHAMERDGLDSSVMDRDHNLPAKTASCDIVQPKEKDSHRRARLHWKTLRKVTSNSLWAKIDQDDQLEKIQIDEAEFQELFQVEKSDEANVSLTARTTKPSVKRGVCVIDPKRANNGGIILARLKMSHDEMADAVDRINENALTAEQIEHIIEYLPTKEERKALEAYMLEGGQDAAEKFDRLCECEKFMVSMMTVKHAKRKVRALLFKLQFRTCLEDIYNDTVAVESACDELNNSVRLRQLFGIILTFGNRLNTVGSGKQRRAGAFTLDSLLKLKQAKAFDRKTTFLHYIVLIVRRNNEILLRFKDDLPSVFKADKIFWDQCVNDLEEIENQLENVRKISLYQARHSHTYRLRRKKRDDDAESLSDGDVELSLEEEVELLRSTPIGQFALSAIKYVSSLRDKVEVTKTKFERLLEYFGDEERKLQPHELFGIIVTFSRDFDKANEEVVANEKKKQREERKRQAVSKTGPGRPPTYSPAQKQGKGPVLKASNHQPTMFHVLNEIKAKVATKEAASSHPVHPQRMRRIDESPPVVQREKSPLLSQQSSIDKSTSSHLFVTAQNAGLKEPAASQLNAVRSASYPQKAPLDTPSKLSSIQDTQINASTPSPLPKNLTTRQESVTKAGIMQSNSAASNLSTTVTPRAHNILREKARQRRQRYIQERSPPPPPPQSQLASPEQGMATPPLVRNRSPETNDDGAQPVLSPRSSMRLRMEHRVQRNRASATSSK